MGMWMWSMDNSFVRGESNDDTNRCTLPYAMLCNNHNFNKLSLSAACLDKGPFTTIRYAMQQCTRVAEKCHLICLHCCISVQASDGRTTRSTRIAFLYRWQGIKWPNTWFEELNGAIRFVFHMKSGGRGMLLLRCRWVSMIVFSRYNIVWCLLNLLDLTGLD